MSYQYPEIKKDKTVNTTPNSTNDWSNKTCNAQEIYNPNSKTRNLNSQQSPININTEAVQECHLLCKMDINYKPSKCHIERTEQGIIKFNWDKGSFINFNNNRYELKHIQIHTPSMHHIDNKSSEMEINLYHYNHESMEELFVDEDQRYSSTNHQDHINKKKRIKDKSKENSKEKD